MAGLIHRSDFVMGSLGGAIGASLPSGESYSYTGLTAAQVATITGQATPTLMYRGDEASGATELVAGVANLTDVGTPTHSTNSTALGGNSVQFTINSADSMDGADGTVGDVGAETITGIAVIELTATTTANKQIIGNRTNAAGNNGWIFKGHSASALAFSVDTPSETLIVGTGATHIAEVLVVGFTRSVAGNLIGIWSKDGSGTGSSSLNETCTNADPFSIGAGPLRTSEAFRFGLCMLWIGTDGDFGAAAAFESARLAIAQALGYE